MTTEPPAPELTTETPEYDDPLAAERAALVTQTELAVIERDDNRAYRAQVEDTVRGVINELAAIEAAYDDEAKRHREELTELGRRRAAIADSLRGALAAIPEPAPTAS